MIHQAVWSHCAQAWAGTTHTCICRRHAVIHCVQALCGGELATERVEACVNEMSYWMRKNKLQLNDSNTEIMIIYSVHNHSKVNTPHIQVGDSEIQPVSLVTNIGAQLDEILSMMSQVNSLCNRAHFHLRNISKIRHLLNRRTTATLGCVYVTSRLDNGNVLLCGLPQTQLSKVQRFQNTAARLVCLTGRREHVTPVVKELHTSCLFVSGFRARC